METHRPRTPGRQADVQRPEEGGRRRSTGTAPTRKAGTRDAASKGLEGRGEEKEGGWARKSPRAG